MISKNVFRDRSISCGTELNDVKCSNSWNEQICRHFMFEHILWNQKPHFMSYIHIHVNNSTFLPTLFPLNIYYVLFLFMYLHSSSSFFFFLDNCYTIYIAYTHRPIYIKLIHTDPDSLTICSSLLNPRCGKSCSEWSPLSYDKIFLS